MVIRTRCARAVLILGTLASLLLAGSTPAHAGCAANTGAVGTPSVFWGALEPTDVGALPGERDTTKYTGGKEILDGNTPLFGSLDAEAGYVFTSYAYGFKVWDVTGGNASRPELVATVDQAPGCNKAAGSFLVNIGCQEQRWLLWDVDATGTNADYTAVAGIEPFGVSVWDTSNKQSPKIVYQDTGPSVHQVFATTIGGRPYAFGASSGPDTAHRGLHIYDMKAAVDRFGSSTGCHEDSASSAGCGVYKGKLDDGAYNYVDGFTTAGGRTFVIASGGPGDNFALGTTGIRMWEVTNPNSPIDLGTMFAGEYVNGVAAWEQGGRQFVGFQPYGAGGRIHEISSCLSKGCSNPPQRWTGSWPSSLNSRVRWVTYSKAQSGTGYLYFGTEDLCIDEVQGEWIFDLSGLTPGSGANTALEEITPDATEVQDGKQVGYWSHYYPTRTSGFNRLHPRVGKFHGNHFYRAAWTVFDVHELTIVDPKVTVTGPGTGYSGTTAAFTASAAACTPNPTGWTWSTDGGTGAGNTATANITWSTTGTKTVSASNSACPGAEAITSTIVIADPAPAVGSLGKSPANPVVCQPVTLTAGGVTGKPPLSYAWTVKDASGTPVVTGGNLNPFVWDTSSPLVAAGTYTAEVTVSGTGTPAKKTASITLGSLAALPGAGTFAPTNDAFPAGTVQFHVDAPGATAWNWDFGDGKGYTGWTSEPVAGPNPVHSYQTIGTKSVKVQVRNCQEPTGVESAVLQVNIEKVAELEIDTFAGNIFCSGVGCTADQGSPVDFTVAVEGDPTGWSIAWGDGSSDSSGAGNPPAKVTHTFTKQGTFSPVLTITRGPESKSATHRAIIVSAAQPASISISGSSSGQVGQSLTYRASASNCSASPNGWSWSATGASISDTDSTITVSFSSSGSKTITATNSACGSTQGRKVVSIASSGGGGGGGGGTLTASFTFTPAQPKAGESVSFDGSGSSGSKLAYFWEFGDGKTGNGAKVSHTYAKAGSYAVKLSVSDSTCLSAGCPSHTSTKTLVVGGGGPTVEATFDTTASCVQQFGIHSCSAATGEKVFFTGTSEGATAHEWSFGDGTTRTGVQVSHVWDEPGSYAVTYTARNGGASDTASRTFVVEGPVRGKLSAVVVPWIARADADRALPQSSDLDIHNPGDEPLKVKLTFRTRGLPEPDPPQVERTVPAGATLHVPDAMAELFNRPNNSGFLFVEPTEGSAQPVVTSTNHTFREDGESFGQVVPGMPVESLQKAGGAGELTHLVGLNANEERLAYFGISNPNDQPFFYHLRFYDSLGRLVAGTETPGAIARFGQKQYQSEELLESFGIDGLDDYRIEIVPEPDSPRAFIYGANLRRVSFDPSFVRVGRTDAQVAYLVGALNTPGLNDSVFRSDVVLGNTAGETVLCDLTFTGAGFRTEPTAPIQEVLQPGESVRLADAVSRWDVGEAVGALKVSCDAPAGVFPVLQGESYDVSRPGEYYGQFMPALSEDDAAEAGESHTLVGLRKDASHRTTVWLYNPSDDDVAEFDLRYLDADGNEIGRETGIRLGRGKFRQLNPEYHPLPATVPNGFVVRIDVKAGQLLTAAQVVNRSNDPAYIVGQ